MTVTGNGYDGGATEEQDIRDVSEGAIKTLGQGQGATYGWK